MVPARLGLLLLCATSARTVALAQPTARGATTPASMQAAYDSSAFRALQWRLIGVCELAGVAGVLVGLVWAPIGIAAAIGLALLTIGAIAYHVRMSDRVADLAPAVIGVALALTAVVLHTL